MKKLITIIFIFCATIVFAQTPPYRNADTLVASNTIALLQDNRTPVFGVYYSSMRLDTLLAYMIRNGAGGGGYWTLSGSNLSNNTGTQVVITDTLNVGNMATPDGVLNVNVAHHNTGLKAIDVYQSEYNIHPFTLSPKGSAVIYQDEDYGNHPSALSVTAQGSGASVNAAFNVTQNGSSGNACATFQNGNVGINTTTPSSPLEVNGIVTIDNIPKGTVSGDSSLVAENGVIKEIPSTFNGSDSAATTAWVRANSGGGIIYNDTFIVATSSDSIYSDCTGAVFYNNTPLTVSETIYLPKGTNGKHILISFLGSPHGFTSITLVPYSGDTVDAFNAAPYIYTIGTTCGTGSLPGSGQYVLRYIDATWF